MEWTLERLNQFVTVADCGSMTQAARRLGRAQSAVSMAMGLLEADLGLALFQRVGRSVHLTPAGEVMLQEARTLLNQAQALDLRAQALATGQSAQLCVAIDEALPTYILGSVRRGLPFAALIAVMYGLLFVLLQLEQTALVVGSLALFAVLTIVMVATRKVDWYAFGKGEGSAPVPPAPAAPPQPWPLPKEPA